MLEVKVALHIEILSHLVEWVFSSYSTLVFAADISKMKFLSFGDVCMSIAGQIRTLNN